MRQCFCGRNRRNIVQSQEDEIISKEIKFKKQNESATNMMTLTQMNEIVQTGNSLIAQFPKRKIVF